LYLLISLFVDLIAIPDFAAGAMENWGLITYRETSILYDDAETSSAAHQWVAIVIAHELAHQVIYGHGIVYLYV
jgi:glutamyl aminopeptidase